MSYHQTTIVGNLGTDPDLKYMQSGDAVCNFSVAVNEKWKNQAGEPQERTTWYRVAVWGAQAEPCHTYLKKGSQVMIVGTTSARGYIAQDGSAAASLDLKAQTVRFLSGGNGASSPPESEEDIPF